MQKIIIYLLIIIKDMESIDLFEHYDTLPNELQKLLNRFSELDNTYFECEILLNECKKLGYTFDYYLDAIPFNLKKI